MPNTSVCAMSSMHYRGSAFDHAYLTAQMQDHQKTANLRLWQLSYGQNAERAQTLCPPCSIILNT